MKLKTKRIITAVISGGLAFGLYMLIPPQIFMIALAQDIKAKIIFTITLMLSILVAVQLDKISYLKIHKEQELKYELAQRTLEKKEDIYEKALK